MSKQHRIYEIRVRLPHIVAAALTAEEIGRAAGSTKLRGIGIPLPYTHRGRPTIVRLWATWAKQPKDGEVRLEGFQVRLGQRSTGARLLNLMAEADGSLVARVLYYPGFPPRVREIEQCLREAEASAGADDPLAVLARNAVADGRATFCACCGRVLTDPVSVQTGIGPECGSTFHAAFRRRWAESRATLMEAGAMTKAGDHQHAVAPVPVPRHPHAIDEIEVQMVPKGEAE